MALRLLVLTLALPFLLLGAIGCGGDDGAKPKISGSQPKVAEKGSLSDKKTMKSE